MTIEEIVNVIVNNGIAIGILIYYIIKDYKFTETLTKTLTMLETSIENLKDVIENGEFTNSTKKSKNQ